MEETNYAIARWLTEAGWSETYVNLAVKAVIILGILVVAYAAAVLFRRLVVPLLQKISARTKAVWDDHLFSDRVMHRAARLIPPLIWYVLLRVAFYDTPVLLNVLHKACLIYLIVAVLQLVAAFLDTLYEISSRHETLRNRPLKGVYQMIKLLAVCVGAILIVSILIGQDATAVLAGLGASAAIIMLIFRDSILGLVAGVQLSANDMLRPGDWITMAKYGADGMRMAMLISSSAGNDVMFDEALCEQGRNFGNKIWNAYRLVNGWSADDKAAQDDNNRLAVEWFRQTLGRALRQIDEDFRSYRISEAFMTAYKLFWDDFSGLYLEMVKPAYGQPVDAETFAATCGFFDELMRVLHPFMPFVTEEIWQDLAPRKEGESICTAPMPQPVEADERLLARFELAKEAISSVRNIRNQKNLPQKEALTLKVIADENYPAEYAPVMRKMANLTAVETVTEKDPAAAAFIVKTTQYFVPMAGKIDVEAEIGKLTESLAYYEGFLASVMKKLSNERFVQSAPEKVVMNERAKQADAEAKIAAIREQLAALK